MWKHQDHNYKDVTRWSAESVVRSATCLSYSDYVDVQRPLR